MGCAGPTRIGDIIPARAASTTPRKGVSSQGCATAVGSADNWRAAAIKRSYLSCWRASERSLIRLAMGNWSHLPSEIHGDIARQAVRPGHDLGGELVTQRPQLFRVKVVGFSSKTAEGIGPLRICDIDASPPVAAKAARE